MASDAARKIRPASRARRYAPVAVVALVAWLLLAWAAASWLVVSDAPPKADALVVLAGSATYVERARKAAELYGEERAPFVVLTNDGQRSGWDAASERNPLFIERAGEELRRAGVPGGRVEVVGRVVTGTFDEAGALREYAAARGLRSLLVVTSGYQSRRALWTLRRVFEGSGVEVGVEAVEPGRQTPRAALWWLSPLGWKLVPGEYAKLIYYRLRY
ncbi:MAG TPA: ElyC/SanA/YdcF family protein [Pyrinomonadaceae bacterium]|nr:ElyC/SanA/YdcF family protein [Pyrinomonadaceae bacterium]